MSVLLIAAVMLPGRTAAQQPADPAAQYRDHLKKGDVYLSQKNYAAAMFEYEKAADLMPDEDQPKLKMQSIEATLGINELAEVKKKVEQARQKEREALEGKKPAPAAAAEEGAVKVSTVQSDSRIDSLKKVIRDMEDKKLPDAGTATAYAEIGSAYYSSGNFQDALSAFEKSLSLEEKTGDKAGQSNVMAEIANVYETTYEYREAISFYQKSARLKETLKDDKGLKDVTNNLGDVYYKQKLLTNSILSYEKTVGIIQKLNMKEALGPVYNKMGVAHYEMGNYADAKKFFRESLKSLNESGNRKEASMTMNNLGNLLYIDNNFSEAISYYERSLASKKESKYDFGKAVTLFNLGNAYRRQGNQEMAIKSYEASKRIADSLGIPGLTAKTRKALAVSYEASRKFEQAEQLEAELATMNQSSVSIEVPVSENEMDLDYAKTKEILSKLNEEALKRKELAESGADKKVTDMYINSLNNRYMQEQKKTRMLVMVASALGVVLLGAVVVLLKRKRKK